MNTNNNNHITFEMILTLFEGLDEKQAVKSRPIRKALAALSPGKLIELAGMADMPRVAYLFHLKYHRKIRMLPYEHDIILKCGLLNFANLSYLAFAIHFLSIENDHLIIEGTLSFPEIVSGQYRVYASCDGKRIYGETGDSIDPGKLGEYVYDRRSWTVFRIPLSGDLHIRFFNEVKDRGCKYGKINSLRFSPVADCLQNQYAVIEDRIITVHGDMLFVKSYTKALAEEQERLFSETLKAEFPQKAEWAIALRRKALEAGKTKTKPIWLFIERYDKAGDNAEVMFRYVQSHPEIDSYFIISEGSADYERMKGIGKTVALYSEQHYLLALIADLVLSSQVNGFIENPFWDDAELFRDLYHRSKIIFLQHGVTKDDQSHTLKRCQTNFAAFITSTKAEYRSLLDKSYGYPEKAIWLTGMPRFDELYNAPQKMILFIPTWRKGNVHPEWIPDEQNMIWQLNEDAYESEYYKRYVSLLSNPKMRECCSRHGYRIVFHPHPLAVEIGLKIAEETGCEVLYPDISYKDLFAAAALMITDYSSVAFDFAYLGKPIIYYQYDEEEFFRQHTYTKGYFDYREDGFGEVLTNESKVVDKICAYIENNMNTERKYAERMQSAFMYHDQNNCERIFRKLTELNSG